jgi:hypothetical protein
MLRRLFTLGQRTVAFVALGLIVTAIGAGLALGAPAAIIQTGDNHIQFQTAGQDLPHDINVIDNKGGLRFYGCPNLTTIPECAAIQFFGNASSGFPGQLFIDSGANNSAAIIFRTAGAGETVTERLRITRSGTIFSQGLGVFGGPQCQTPGDICSGHHLIADDDLRVGSQVRVGSISDSCPFTGNVCAQTQIRSGVMDTGLCSSVGDMCAGNNLVADQDMKAAGRGVIGSSTGDSSRGIFTVHGPDASVNTEILRVEDSSNNRALSVFGNGNVAIGSFVPGSTTAHVCHFVLAFTACSSAAEYVPTLDAGLGAPEATDLVSIAPGTGNPYGDDHSPFVVTKSATSCDPNLLGFLLDPASGADGKKVNDSYLPLAIYGYFPAKVTMENGAIRRGDAITSSSTPGAGMKSTGACKVIGYALEDAEEDGTVQVFAHFTESTVGEVTALRAQVQDLQQALSRRSVSYEVPVASDQDAKINALEQENAELKASVTDLSARLATLEQRSAGDTAPTSAQRLPGWLLAPIALPLIGLAGMAVVWHRGRRTGQE